MSPACARAVKETAAALETAGHEVIPFEPLPCKSFSNTRRLKLIPADVDAMKVCNESLVGSTTIDDLQGFCGIVFRRWLQETD